jgi:hypothetical protein
VNWFAGENSHGIDRLGLDGKLDVALSAGFFVNIVTSNISGLEKEESARGFSLVQKNIVLVKNSIVHCASKRCDLSDRHSLEHFTLQQDFLACFDAVLVGRDGALHRELAISSDDPVS